MAIILYASFCYGDTKYRIKETKNTGEIREGYISVPGGNIWFKIVGADKKGIPLLTLHGGPGAPHDYLEPLEALSDERPVIFYDQLGCGNSDKPENKSLWRVKRFVEELHFVRSALRLGKIHILGQSWGTMLAVDYMLTRKPRGVVSLVLSAPCLSASRFIADQRKYLLEFPEDMQKIIRDAEASGNYDSPQYDEAEMKYYKRHVCRLDPWPDCMERTLKKSGRSVYEYMWGPSEFTMTGTLKKYERAKKLKQIKIPVLFTAGQYDEATPATTSYYQSMLPGSEIAIFEDASHEHHIEKPEQYLKTVRDFLRRAEKR
ncbi:MAG: proline iminopeptidase [Syntrophus sp. (in: bacteria)]|nr:proline iminopeptidase [Syntrophus sp. (in: bacteria)]